MSELCDTALVNHQFDNEDEVSLRHLYKSFCNHVMLGQWELARVCLKRLFARRQSLEKPLKDVLRAFIDRPTLAGTCSPSVLSPLHFSWLCLVDYLQLFTANEDKLPAPISRTVEFHLILFLNNWKNAPKQVLQELHDFYCKIVYGDTSSYKDGVLCLSAQTIHFLETLLDEDPEFGHAFISLLFTNSKIFLENNQTLQNLYINCINRWYDIMKNENSLQTNGSEPSLSQNMIKETKKNLYQLLSYVNVSQEMLSLNSTLQSLLENLCKLTKVPVCHSTNLEIGNLYSCLLQRQSNFMIAKFCQTENLLRLPDEGDDERLSPGMYSKGSQTMHVYLSQLNNSDRKEAMKLLFFYALDGNHVLENIVETSLLLIKDGNFSKVSEHLKEFGVLKPLVLLLGWPYCYSCDNAKQLLDTLWDQTISHPLLYQACEKLAYQVQLVQWCLEKAGLLLASNGAGSTHHQQASEMFQGLESHSVLRVLHKSINLALLPENEVFALLRKRPVFSPGTDSQYECSKVDEDSDISCVSHDENMTQMCIHPDVERDLILYHSFCALKCFMSCVFSQVESCITSCKTNPNSSYSSVIVDKLLNGRKHLNNVFPLTYRIEILENIFSLLFIRFEDLFTENTHHESDGLDTGDDDTKSLNTSFTGSMESLTSIASIDVTDILTHSSPLKEQLGSSTHSTPESSTKRKGHSRSGSYDSKRQLFQTVRQSNALPGGVKIGKEESNKGTGTSTTTQSYFKTTKSDDDCELSKKPKMGFIINNGLVLDYLKTLKDCLVDVNTHKLLERQSEKAGIYNDRDWMYTSVGSNVLEQRISRLSQYIVEAQWRYQLVSWTGDTKSETSSSHGLSSQIQPDTVGVEKTQTRQTRHQSERTVDDAIGKESPDADKVSDESSSYQSQELTTGTEDNILNSKVSKKKHIRHGRRTSLREGIVVRDDSIVARMLSSPETLISLCLRKDSYDRAQQVIKMFLMQGSLSAKEAIFAEKFSNAFKELSSLQPRTRQSVSHRKASRALGAVAKAAASGVSSSLSSNLIDQLLSLSITSPIMMCDLDPNDDSIKKSPLYWYVRPELMPAMVCLDMACTANVPQEVCKNLLDTAKNRLPQVLDVALKSENYLTGVASVLSDLHQLLQTSSNEKSSQASQQNLADFLMGRESLQYKLRILSSKHENQQQQSIKRMVQALQGGDSTVIAVQEAASKLSRTSEEKQQKLQESFSLVEKSLSVRVGLTELQAAFDCTSDHAIGSVCTRRERFDYIRSLLNHVDTLATLLLHWQSKPDDFSSFSKETSKGVAIKASNPFVVLNKGIADTFGKPMFEKNVSPKRLEGICKQLNINLVKVIVHNCCQHIPSNGFPCSGYSWPSSEVLILNGGSHWMENGRDPNVVAKELLNNMINLLTDLAKSNNGLVDANNADVAVCSPQFSSIVQGTSELQRVDLDLLQTNESKLCFFINIFNLLIAHASLLKYSSPDNDHNMIPLTRHGSLGNLCRSSSASSCCESKQDGISSIERISFLKQHCYTIGQMGPTSAFDILFTIIRTGMFPPTMFGSAIQLCYPERPIDDPKRKYRPVHQEKRVVFAVNDGCLSSPDLQVYDTEHLEFQLNAAAMAYVNSHVNITTDEVVLPELLKWYKSDFTHEPYADIDSSVKTQVTNINFLLLLEPYLNDKKATLLQSLLPGIKEITYTPFSWKFGYQFDVSSLDHSESSSSLQRSSSLPDSLYLSLESSGGISMSLVESRGNFQPTSSALEYISKASPLVSTLVELVCPSREEKTKPEQRKATLSNVFSDILQKLKEYPVLQRCIASRFYCMAEFLSTAADEFELSSIGSYEFVGADVKHVEEDDTPSTIKIKSSPIVLSAKNSSQLQHAYYKSSDFFLRQGNFYNLLELIKTADFHSDGGCGDAVDYLLSSAVLSKTGPNGIFLKRLDALFSDLGMPSLGFSHKWNKRPYTLFAQIKDNNELAQLVLSHLKEYKAKVGIDLLNLAICRPPKNTALRRELIHRKNELTLHNKIAQCAKAPQLRISESMDKLQPSPLLTQWPGVASQTIDDPRQIMDFLLSIQQYELAGNWAELHGLPSEFHKTIKEKQLKYLLDNRSEDTMKAYCILEGIQEQHMALDICQSLLHQQLHVSQILFIIQFMLTNLQPHLSPLRIEELLLAKMGAKALLCIPEMARSSYEHLVSRPYLLLEQLLMNLKVEWAAQVFSRLQVDLALMADSMVEGGTGSQSCTVDTFDALLSNYAAKALEFQVVQAQISPESTMGTTDIPSGPSSLTGHGNEPSPTIDIPTPSTREFQASLSQSIISSKRIQTTYVPPAIPPRKEEWMPDAQALECIVCKLAFSMFNRRHHCRRCGRVVCGNCSTHNCIVQNYGNTPVRVCDACFSSFEPRIGNESRYVDKTDISASPAHSGPSSLKTTVIDQEGLSEGYSTSPYSIEVKAESEMSNKWKLTLEPETNNALRDEFYFEQAPSSSLCVAILDLHSVNHVCGNLLLDLCNTLSKKLVPITPGIRNDEVDHNLIISMIRHLLFNAKLKMIKAGENDGLELCDTYLSHVELMKFLVESNCGDIPSLQDLTRPDSARRLRDRFIEDERLTLAMEVSTKCGLEPSSVWAASGFACLQAGDLLTAREKFSKCMKPSDGKSQQKQHSQYLDKIVEILQTSPLISYSQSTDDILSPLHGLAEHCKSSSHSVLDTKRFDECLYYLQLYGTDTSLVTFYGRHGHLRLACRYILEKKCNPDVFVESLLMRLISKGSISSLKEQMETSDPSLQSWMPYLTASCRFLDKRGYHHLLYDLQLFMKDYFRAAQTCIRFFEGSSSSSISYKDLFSRLDYLNKARSHLETVIIEKKSPRGTVLGASSWLRSHNNLSRRKSSEDSQHTTVTLPQLTSHVNTVNLQIEVTKFIHKCYVDGGHVTQYRVTSNDEKVPTLFGKGQVKAELAIQVLLSGVTIQDGFSLTSRIIQDYNLPAPRVYVDAGRALARQYRFNHILQLLNCVSEVSLLSDKCYDDIILACVRIVSTDQNQAKNVDNLIKLLKSDSNKIDAFLLCGKLRSAYLIAVKEKNVEAVQMIAEEARKTGQTKTLNLCSKWLSLNQ